MFVKKFSKSPNLVSEQTGPYSFNLNMIKHKKSQSRQITDLNNLNSAVIKKVRTKLNKTAKRSKDNSDRKESSPSNITNNKSSVEPPENRLPPRKMQRDSFYRSRS